METNNWSNFVQKTKSQFCLLSKKHKVLRRLRIRPIWGVHCKSYIGNYYNCHFSLLLKHEMFLVRTKLPSGENPSLTQKANFAQKSDNLQYNTLHRGAFCQFPFRRIYYCHSSKSIGKENWQNAPLCSVLFLLMHLPTKISLFI